MKKKKTDDHQRLLQLQGSEISEGISTSQVWYALKDYSDLPKEPQMDSQKIYLKKAHIKIK